MGKNGAQKMINSRWNRKRVLVAAVIGTMLLVACPVQAQNPRSPRDNTAVAPIEVDSLPNTVEVGDGKPLQVLNSWLDELYDLTALEGERGVVADHEILLARLHDPADETLGVTLRPVSEALRRSSAFPPDRDCSSPR